MIRNGSVYKGSLRVELESKVIGFLKCVRDDVIVYAYVHDVGFKIAFIRLCVFAAFWIEWRNPGNMWNWWIEHIQPSSGTESASKG